MIEKKNFRLLLEEHPDIASDILKTLSERVKSMMEKILINGKTALELPKNLSEPQHISSGVDLENMKALAQILRELNKRLSSGGARTSIARKKIVTPVTLLPTWYIPFEEVEFAGWGNAMMLEQKECVCAYCGNGFKEMIPSFSRLKQVRKTLDQRIIYDKFNILIYTNIVCPNCNYCDTYYEFIKKHKSFQKLKVEGNQFINTEKFTGYPHETKRTLEAVIIGCFLNLACLEQIPGSSLRRAKAWQRLYWIYSDYGRKKEAGMAAREVIRHYHDYLSDNRNEISMENYMMINLILGEMYNYCSEKEKACKYFVENTKINGFTDHDIAVKSLNRLNELSENISQ